MPREISEITQQDREFMGLRDEVLKVIPIAEYGDEEGKKVAFKKWDSFRTYMDTYYNDDETGPGGTKAATDF